MPFRTVLLAVFLISMALAIVVGLLAEQEETLPSPSSVVLADVSSERLTRHGPVVGFTDTRGSLAWLGVPYARPPVGPDRWRAPKPPHPWTDTFDALEPGAPCARTVHPSRPSEPAGLEHVGREDCLTLDVWSPGDREVSETVAAGTMPVAEDTAEPSGLRPVMVWIHGEVGRGGSADSRLDGGRLAMRQDLVVVAISYRLGPLGWFAHESLVDPTAGPVGQSGNFGTLDVIAGLNWVHDNIEAFGGDPGNVTIFGESSGGSQVMSLLLAPRARGLFHRAIVQGGSLASLSHAEATAYVDADEPGRPYSSGEIVLELVQRGGSVSNREQARAFVAGLSLEQLADYLRERSLAEILEVHESLERSDPLPVSPKLIRDGIVLPKQRALERFADVRGYNAVPIILGSNRDPMKRALSQNPEFVKRYLEVLFRLRDADREDLLARFASELSRLGTVHAPASALHAAQGPSVYVYRFDWDEQPVAFGDDLDTVLKESRGIEIPTVLVADGLAGSRAGDPTTSELDRSVRSRLSEAVMSYWAEFARTGSPGRARGGALPEWRPWQDAGYQGEQSLVLDSREGGGIRMVEAERPPAHDVAGDLDRCALVVDLIKDAGMPGAERAHAFRALGCERAAGSDL